MNEPGKLLIGRCSFWAESRDPEAWLRALVTLSQSAQKFGTQSWTSPRVIGDTVLSGHLSRRAVPGLFGLDLLLRSRQKDAKSRLRCITDNCQAEVRLIHGVGLLERSTPSDPQPFWQLSTAAHTLLTTWQTSDHRHALEQLALFLLRRSVWLRLLLLKLQVGDWQLLHWNKVRASNGQLRLGQTLLLGADTDPAHWLAGLEESALGAWRSELTPPFTVQIHAPKTAKRDDGLSLSPLKSPLYLLDSLGWLDADGRLRLPDAFASDPLLQPLLRSTISATVLLDQAAKECSDPRGLFPLEPVMLRFAHALDIFPNPSANDSAFIAWTDQLLSESFRAGIVELLASEPGQPRHGRGLFGDAQQKLLRWRVHEGFDALCAQVTAAFRKPVATQTL